MLWDCDINYQKLEIFANIGKCENLKNRRFGDIT